jgi:cytochrome c peroxidase
MAMWRLSNIIVLLSACELFAQPPGFASRDELIEWLRTEYTKAPAEWPKPTLDEGVIHRELGTPGPVPFPEGMEPTKEKRELGLSLFFDPRLSGSQQISCSRCHDPEKGWSDGRSLATGVFMEQLTRNTPGLQGVGHHQSLFWDGRAPTLEAQAVAVITNPKEMAGDPAVIVDRLIKQKEFYGPKFAAAFGDEDVTFDRIVQALAAFQRGLGTGRSAFDRFLAGKHDDLSDSALAGLHLFRTQARCLNCHNGPEFTDHRFHNAGLTYYGRRFEDQGRYAVTRKPEDMGKFRTPSLRNVGNTGPWMHNGLFPSMRGILNLYNAGMPRPKPKDHQMNDSLFPETSPLLKPLDLTVEQRADLEAFLMSLDEPSMRVLTPPFPPLNPG